MYRKIMVYLKTWKESPHRKPLIVDNPMKPLENYRNIDAFKIYVSDIGLLCAKKDIVVEDILYGSAELDDEIVIRHRGNYITWHIS